MTGQDLFLAMILAAFATFTVTLVGVSLLALARRA